MNHNHFNPVNYKFQWVHSGWISCTSKAPLYQLEQCTHPPFKYLYLDITGFHPLFNICNFLMKSANHFIFRRVFICFQLRLKMTHFLLQSSVPVFLLNDALLFLSIWEQACTHTKYSSLHSLPPPLHSAGSLAQEAWIDNHWLPPSVQSAGFALLCILPHMLEDFQFFQVPTQPLPFSILFFDDQVLLSVFQA